MVGQEWNNDVRIILFITLKAKSHLNDKLVANIKENIKNSKKKINNDNQKKIAEKVLQDVNQRLSGKVVTKISLIKNYCPAEEYHQKYLEKK